MSPTGREAHGRCPKCGTVQDCSLVETVLQNEEGRRLRVRGWTCTNPDCRNFTTAATITEAMDRGLLGAYAAPESDPRWTR